MRQCACRLSRPIDPNEPFTGVFTINEIEHGFEVILNEPKASRSLIRHDYPALTFTRAATGVPGRCTRNYGMDGGN
jgi:hypothetical protein